VELKLTELDNGTRKVSIHGRLDTSGVGSIETRFIAATASSGKNTIVDLSDVPYLTSMGIRMLIVAAKAAKGKNAKIVLFGVQGLVREVFDHVSLGHVIPIASDEKHALEILKA